MHLDIWSVEACKEKCLETLGVEGCKGIEFNSRSGRCETWKRPEGIWAFGYPEWEGFTCLRFGWPGKYLIPVDGGLDQACRGPDGKNSDSRLATTRVSLPRSSCLHNLVIDLRLLHRESSETYGRLQGALRGSEGLYWRGVQQRPL